MQFPEKLTNQTLDNGEKPNFETGFLICKSEIPVMKNIPPSLDGIIFACNQKCNLLMKKSIETRSCLNIP